LDNNLSTFCASKSLPKQWIGMQGENKKAIITFKASIHPHYLKILRMMRMQGSRNEWIQCGRMLGWEDLLSRKCRGVFGGEGTSAEGSGGVKGYYFMLPLLTNICLDS